MPVLTVNQAINDALKTEMRLNEDTVVFGEDVGVAGGVFRTTADLQEEFGEKRVFDTPLAESGIIGTAIGMALYGLRPIPEIQFMDFIYPAFDQLVSEMAKFRYRSGGEYSCPMVVRTPYGGGIRGGHYHSQSAESYFLHTPGIKVVIPSDPYDAKGLLISSIRDDDPVLFMEPKRIYRSVKGEVPEGEYTVPLGEAIVRREGDDVTLVGYGAMIHTINTAADQAAEKGWSAEVVDLRTLCPLDKDTMLESVKKTGRCVIIHEAPRVCGFGGELSAIVTEHVFDYLQAPTQRVTGFDTPFPYTLEHDYLPDAGRILSAIERVMEY